MMNINLCIDSIILIIFEIKIFKKVCQLLLNF